MYVNLSGHDMAQTVTSLSIQRLRFITRPISMGFVIVKVALGQVFLQVLQSFPVIMILFLHTYISFISCQCYMWCL